VEFSYNIHEHDTGALRARVQVTTLDKGLGFQRLRNAFSGDVHAVAPAAAAAERTGRGSPPPGPPSDTSSPSSASPRWFHAEAAM